MRIGLQPETQLVTVSASDSTALLTEDLMKKPKPKYKPAEIDAQLSVDNSLLCTNNTASGVKK